MSANDYETAYLRISKLARASAEVLMDTMDEVNKLKRERDSLLAEYRRACDELAVAEAALAQCRCRRG